MSFPGLGRGTWPRDWQRRYQLLLVALFLCRGVMVLCVIPPLEGWDEYQHVAYVVHLVETGQAPVFGQSFVPDSLLAAIGKLPQPKDALGSLGSERAVDYGTFWSRGPATPNQVSQPPVAIYEAQHCSLYYRLAAPLFTAAGGVADLRLSVAVLRLANVLFVAGALWLALGAIGRICSDRWDAALLGLLIALHPYFLLNGARVANDALGVLLGTAVVVCCLSFVGRRLWLASALLGALLGLAVLAKACNLALLPLAAFWGPALVIRRKAPLARGLAAALVVGAGFAAVAGPYFYFNLTHFGVLTPMAEAISNRQAGRGFRDLASAALQFPWPEHLAQIWLSNNLWSGGWTFLSPSERMQNVYQWVITAGLLGALTLWGRRAWLRLPVAGWPLTVCLFVCLSFAAGLAYDDLHIKQATQGVAATLPHYAAVAWPWFLTLFYAGCASYADRRLRLGLPWVLAGVFLATEFHGLFVRMIEAYVGKRLGVAALERLASLQPAFLGTATLYASTAGVLLLTAAAVGVQIAALRRATSTTAPADNPTPVSQNRAA